MAASKNRNSRLKLALLGSVLVHLMMLVAAGVIHMVQRLPDRAKDADKYVMIELEPNRRDTVVRSEKGEKVKEPEKDAFLGKDNRRVREESAGQVGSAPVNVAGAKTVGGQPQQPAEQQPAEDEKQQQAKKGADQAADRPLAKFGVPLFRKTPTREVFKQARRRPDHPQWVPHGGPLQQLSGDYVEGLKPNEYSALNTREFVFFSYFQRIRERLDLAWQPILSKHLEKLFRKGRYLASDKDYTTRTIVTLNNLGEIVRVSIVGQSGTRDLDDAAVEAFNRAGPFPNPPKGLIDQNGEVQLRWDFILRT